MKKTFQTSNLEKMFKEGEEKGREGGRGRKGKEGKRRGLKILRKNVEEQKRHSSHKNIDENFANYFFRTKTKNKYFSV